MWMRAGAWMRHMMSPDTNFKEALTLRKNAKYLGAIGGLETSRVGH